MKGFYAPCVYLGGGQWVKQSVVLMDEDGNLSMIEPFRAESERTIACQGILMPALQINDLTHPDDVLRWMIDQLKQEQGLTVTALLERMVPHVTLVPGCPVSLWHLDEVEFGTSLPGTDSTLEVVYP